MSSIILEEMRRCQDSRQFLAPEIPGPGCGASSRSVIGCIMLRRGSLPQCYDPIDLVPAHSHNRTVFGSSKLDTIVSFEATAACQSWITFQDPKECVVE